MKVLVGNSRARSRAQSRRRWVSATLAVLGIAAASVWALQPEEPTRLRSAQPDLSAHVGRSPDQVQLDFARPPLSGSLAEVVVLGPDDKNHARGPAVTTADGVSQPVGSLPDRGAYQVVYEVPLVDGEVARGEYWFWYQPNASGSSSRLESPALLGLLVALVAALATALLAPGRARRSVIRVPAQRTASTPATTSTHPLPAQRSRDRHEGLSPPGRSRPGTAPPQSPAAPTRSDPPRQV